MMALLAAAHELHIEGTVVPPRRSTPTGEREHADARRKSEALAQANAKTKSRVDDKEVTLPPSMTQEDEEIERMSDAGGFGHGNLKISYDESVERDDRVELNFLEILSQVAEAVADTDADIESDINPQLGVDMGKGGKGPIIIGYYSYYYVEEIAKHVPNINWKNGENEYALNITAQRRTYAKSGGYTNADRREGETEGVVAIFDLRSCGSKQDADYSCTYAKPVMFAQAVEQIDGLKVYSASRPRMKAVDEDGEEVTLGKGTKGTRICLTIGHAQPPTPRTRSSMRGRQKGIARSPMTAFRWSGACACRSMGRATPALCGFEPSRPNSLTSSDFDSPTPTPATSINGHARHNPPLVRPYPLCLHFGIPQRRGLKGERWSKYKLGSARVA